MERNQQRILELEKEIVETSTCIFELQSNISHLPVGDPERVGACRLMWRLMEARIVAYRSLRAMEQGAEPRPVRH